MTFPLRYARRNLLIGRGGEAAALYRVNTRSYPFLPVPEKWAVLWRLERFAHLVGADFSMWRVQRAYPAERYAAELENLADALRRPGGLAALPGRPRGPARRARLSRSRGVPGGRAGGAS